MPHIDEETLALLALGEDVLDDDARAHLAACLVCAAAAADLGRVAELARSGLGPDALVAPDPRVWGRVHAELGLSQVPADLGGPSGPAAPAPVTPAPAAPAPSTPASGEAPGPGASSGADVVPLRPRRTRTWLAAAAACLALLLGVAGGVWWERRQALPPETVVATTDLEALPGWAGASGAARVEETPDGRRQVVVSLDAPVPAGAFREVWLLTPDVSGLVSLGVLEGDEGRFDVPEGLDLAAFPVVDVSEEPLDGDPAHSGDSVVRGTLDA
ncbi:anti-sigma factor [Puerhibacterium sp. TATVAM-FAB25]|uniref:anti-sigma factor n=1 Tax=Puerhibacterium sp. TATVAM-FAB25 TaxID=3093699 RepID=UPI00397AA77F